MTERDYSLRRGMQLLISDFMLIFPFLVSFIAALVVETIMVGLFAASAYFGLFTTGNSIIGLSIGAVILDSVVVFIVILIETFGVIWQSDSASIRGKGYRFGLESSFRGTAGSIGKYAMIMVFMAVVGAAINLIPLFGGSLSNLWLAYSAFALMLSVITGRSFYDTLSGGANLLQKLYEDESSTGLFFALVIIVSVVPVISGLALLIEIIFGSAVLVTYEENK